MSKLDYLTWPTASLAFRLRSSNCMINKIMRLIAKTNCNPPFPQPSTLVPRLLSTLLVLSRCERTLVLSGHVVFARSPYEGGVGRLITFVTKCFKSCNCIVSLRTHPNVIVDSERVIWNTVQDKTCKFN